MRLSGQASEFNRGGDQTEYENSYPQNKGLQGMLPEDGRGSSYYQRGDDQTRPD